MRMYDTAKRDIERIVGPLALSDIGRIEISPTASGFWQSPKIMWDLQDDFPCIISPFGVTWMEYQMPSSRSIVVEGGGGQPPANFPRQHGMFCFTVPVESEQKAAIMAGNDVMLSLLPQGARQADSNRQRVLKERVKKDEPLWIGIYRHVFLRQSRVVPGINLATYLDERGRAIRGTNVVYGLHPRFFAGEFPREQIGDIQIMVFPFLLALSMCHAKNIEIVDEVVPTRVAKKRRKRGYEETFKILKIRDGREKSGYAEGPNGNASELRSLHVVRGHFKDYREGPGLFGKHQKLVWVNMHARGDHRAGITDKDYTT